MGRVTVWGEDIQRDWRNYLAGGPPPLPLPEYPRPQFVRDSYLCLNGPWHYAVTPASFEGIPAERTGQILVPFPPESELSGVGRRTEPDEYFWYFREITLPPGFNRGAVLLHFGAVDQTATIYLDGVELKTNQHGYLPFEVDVTRFLSDGAPHLLAVRCRDVTDTSHHSRGKQSLKPGGIWYTPHSGIWQTVWLESLPVGHIRGLELRTDHGGRLELRVETSAEALPGGEPGQRGELLEVTVEVRDEASGAIVMKASETAVWGRGGLGECCEADCCSAEELGECCEADCCSAEELGECCEADCCGEEAAVAEFAAHLPGVRVWSPEDPHLYRITVWAGADCVQSYAAMRTVEVGEDATGIPVLKLNGQPLYQAGVLDQGYWPDGLVTAPSDEALAYDIAAMKRAGFNVLRKHIKIEPLRFYHHCDTHGMLVWQDLVSGGEKYYGIVTKGPALAAVHLPDRLHRLFGRANAEGRELFRTEARRTVQLLRNSPSVAVWVPFNEGWGQFSARAMTALLRRADPSRPIDHASGWHDQGAGDILSPHVYYRPIRPSSTWGKDRRAVVLSEYGGYSLRLEGHEFSEKSFGYRTIRSRAELESSWRRLHTRQVIPAIRAGLSGAIYTQLSDVEDELNGLLTADRSEWKIDPAALRQVNDSLAAAFRERATSRHGKLRALPDRREQWPSGEREITEPVDLTLPDGTLNPDAIGWTRHPLHATSGIGRGAGRNKRWEYWAVISPEYYFSLTLAALDYVALVTVWAYERASGKVEVGTATLPLARGVTLPAGLDEGPATGQGRQARARTEPVDGGTRLRGETAGVRFDVFAGYPGDPGAHEALGVVVPWSRRVFQYTVKDPVRPASGWIEFAGRRYRLPAGESWAILDHGRGRWPYSVHWHWGAGAGRSAGSTVGLQLGGLWTDGTGSRENALVVDGRLFPLHEDLTWECDPADRLAPWRVHSKSLDLTLTPEWNLSTPRNLGAVATDMNQVFGVFDGVARLREGGVGEVVRELKIEGIGGFVEDVKNRW